MTNEQIIELANQAGFYTSDKPPVVSAESHNLLLELQRFAELVRNAALNDAALACQRWIDGHNQYYPADEQCTYNDCDFVAAATDCANEIQRLKK